MPTYIRPRRVTVETGGSGVLVLLAAGAVVAIGAAVCAVIDAYLWAIIAVIVVAVAGGSAYFWHVFRGQPGAVLNAPERLRAVMPRQAPAALPARPPRGELAAPAVRLIEVRPAAQDGRVAR